MNINRHHRQTNRTRKSQESDERLDIMMDINNSDKTTDTKVEQTKNNKRKKRFDWK